MVIEVPQTRVATYYLVSLLTPKFDQHNLTFTLSAVLGCRELIGWYIPDEGKFDVGG